MKKIISDLMLHSVCFILNINTMINASSESILGILVTVEFMMTLSISRDIYKLNKEIKQKKKERTEETLADLKNVTFTDEKIKAKLKNKTQKKLNKHITKEQALKALTKDDLEAIKTLLLDRKEVCSVVMYEPTEDVYTKKYTK